eukprot:maker-scaffold_9-snap-gene-4.4-mRNA-1 protein AED:0.02 eAED:0.02 QI:206/1/1/1/1/1/4/88/346
MKLLSSSQSPPVLSQTFEKLTSLDVFLSFTKRNSEGVLVSENIVSQECFNVWVFTRCNKLKYPAGAFKRTISSHLRSVDGRAAFPADVETSILTKFRQKDERGIPIDPYFFLKKPNAPKPRRGPKNFEFTFPYGYHEQRCAAQNSSNQSETATLQISSRRQMGLINRFLPPDIYKDLSKIAHVDGDTLKSLHHNCRGTKYSFYPPAVAYLLRFLMNTSYYYSNSYGRPNKSAQHFEPETPVYLFKCTPTLQVFDLDPIFIQNFGMIYHIFDLHKSATQHFAFSYFASGVTKSSSGSFWIRGLFLFNGTEYPWKGTFRSCKDGVIDCAFQVDLNSPVTEPILNHLIL